MTRKLKIAEVNNVARTSFPEPARPTSGGPYVEPLPLSYYDWVIEPKYNGWRVVVDTESKKLYNRHGNRLSKPEAFRRATEEVSDYFDGLVDCEGMGLRNSMGRGTFIVLDLMDSDDGYDTRTDMIGMMIPQLRIGQVPALYSIYSAPRFGKEEAVNIREKMEAFNKEWEITFYEGVVAKQKESIYYNGEKNVWRKFRFTHDN
jgi:ATP-dependent DNA ligase